LELLSFDDKYQIEYYPFNHENIIITQKKKHDKDKEDKDVILLTVPERPENNEIKCLLTTKRKTEYYFVPISGVVNSTIAWTLNYLKNSSIWKKITKLCILLIQILKMKF